MVERNGHHLMEDHWANIHNITLGLRFSNVQVIHCILLGSMRFIIFINKVSDDFKGLKCIMKKETLDRIRDFTTDRDWDKFHSPANLAKSISIEANELLECFQWSDEDYDLEHVKEELADVLVYCRNMLDKLGLDEDEIVNSKMAKNEAKYPVDKAKGSSKKYTEL